MKILLINGSPRHNSNTLLALKEMEKVFAEEGIETEIINIGTKAVQGCIACEKCRQLNKCVFNNDMVNEVAAKFETADGIIVGSPVYYAAPNASVQALMQRLFYSTHFDKTMKVGAAFVCARRSGATSSFDVLNKFFTNCGMPVVSSQYWNNSHGWEAGEAIKDDEGMQTARTLARNASFLIKAINDAKEKYGLPKMPEDRVWTNFFRD